MLLSYSVNKLNRVCKKQELWCWGCGRRFHEMLELYKGEFFMEKLSILIDKNPDLHGKVIQIEKRTLPVHSYSQIKDKWNGNVIILIAVDSHEEIHDFILKESGNPNIVCCPYPQNYFSYTRLIQSLFNRLPLRRQLLFSAGVEPHENAMAVIEYLEHEYDGKPYRVVLLGNTNKKIQTSHIKVVYLEPNTLRCKNKLGNILRFCWLYSGSKVLFYENQPLKKWNQKQALFFLNHGTIPLKDVHDVLKQPESIDYALCPSKGCTDLYKLQYGIPAEKLIYAMPPRDDFLKKDTHTLDTLMDYNGEQVILWLPTFRTLKGTERRDSSIDNALFLIAHSEALTTINEQLRHNGQLLLIKCHPREKYTMSLPVFCDRVKILADEDLTNAGIILQEMLKDTDALLTDYSGISFEYLLLDKPIGYVVNDMASYTRGFAFKNPKDYMPGTMINTLEDLLKFLNDIKARRDEFQNARKQLTTKLFQGNETMSGARVLLKELEHLDL